MIEEKVVIRKVAWRFVPLLIITAFLAYLDRVNVSFAALTMNADIGLSAAAYGFGASIFFVTYVLTEVPSNIILARVGARMWLARIMFTWGIISWGMMFVQGEISFYILRALLGVAEAGLYPGIVYFMSLWFPASYRARIGSLFWLSIPLSSVIGAPVSSIFLAMDGLLGLKGWMWLFMLESLPTVLMAFVLYAVLRNSPSEAEFLTKDERDWLTRRMASEADTVSGHSHNVLAVLKDYRVLSLGFVCFGAVIINYGVNFFLPQIIKGFGGLSNMQVGFITALPSVAAVCGILLFGYLSDRTDNRRGFVAFAITSVALCLALSTLFPDPVLKMAALIAAGFFMFGYLAPFWAIPHRFFTGAALATAIAAINSIANLGGVVGPYIMGYLKDRTGSFEGGLLTLAAGALIVVPLLLLLGRPREAQPGTAVSPKA